MANLLLQSNWRFYLRHPWQLILCILGIAIGVAVYLGVSLANDSARRAFDLSSEIVLGNVTHKLVAVEDRLDQQHYQRIQGDLGIAQAAPVIEVEVGLVGLVEEAGSFGPRLRSQSLIGIAPFQELGVRSLLASASGNNQSPLNAMTELMTQTNAVMVPALLAGELGLQAGDVLSIIYQDRPRDLQVVAIADADEGESGRLVTDIATAQEIIGDFQHISRIDLILNESEFEQLAEIEFADAILVPAANSDQAFNQLTSAFYINLQAMSLLALVVGIFLVYASVSFAVTQRRKTFGTFRAVGVRKQEILVSCLQEALLIGAIGTVLGLILGQLLAQGLVEIVLRTINDLFFDQRLRPAAQSPLLYVQATLLGLLAALLAALFPALEASRYSPMHAIRRVDLELHFMRGSNRALLLSLASFVVAGVLLRVDSKSLYLGFTAIFLVIIGGALLCPLFVRWLMNCLAPTAQKVAGLEGSMALRGIAASLSRTGTATSALAVAVCTLIGVGVMISSFRLSLTNWLDDSLQADIYVNAAPNAPEGALSELIKANLLSLPGLESFSETRFAEIPSSYGELDLRAVKPAESASPMTLLYGETEAVFAGMNPSSHVLISEPFAYRAGLGIADQIELPTPDGVQKFTVSGVYRDYGTDAGAITLALESYRSIWGDQQTGGLGLYFESGTNLEDMEARVELLIQEHPSLRMFSSRQVRDMAVEVFDRTFQITEVLRLLAGIVAFIGLLSALMALQLERGSEDGLLRALGFTPGQIGRLHLFQASMLGLCAGLLAIPLGTALAALLIEVINKRSFGWFMDLVWDIQPILAALLLAVAAAFLAGLYPAYKSGRVALMEQLRS